MTTDAGAGAAPDLDETGFQVLYEQLRRGADWGGGDRHGALNTITPAHVLAAVGEVRLGMTISMAAVVEHEPAADNPEPWRHQMTYPADGEVDPTGLHFAMDRLAGNVHGNADSHIDALCHVIFDGRLYNDLPADAVGATGATALSIGMVSNGIVGRGVLLDIPRVRGVPWLEPGDHVTTDDLLAAERAQHVQVGQGDLLFVRVGHRRRRDELGPWDAAQARAGLHPTAVRFLADRRVATLGSDGNNDTAPSVTDAVAFPVHVLAINALGLHLLDYLQFEELAPVCANQDHWSFLCVIAPLRLPTATGSLVNPIAIL